MKFYVCMIFVTANLFKNSLFLCKLRKDKVTLFLLTFFKYYIAIFIIKRFIENAKESINLTTILKKFFLILYSNCFNKEI